MKKTIWIVSILIFASILFSACQPTVVEEAAEVEVVEDAVEEEAEPAEKRVVGVSLYTREHTFYNMLEEAIVAEAEKLGYELIVVDGNQDTNTQINQVQDFITQEVDAMILCPTNSAGIAPAIELANDAGIPIFTMDIAAESGVVAHVATDNYSGGVLAGEFAAEYLDGEGQVAIIACPGIESVTMREEGFKAAVEDYPGIEVVQITNCECDGEKAANQTQDMLISYPDLKLVFGAGDPFALGALASINAADREVYVIGFDGLPEGVAEVKKGGLFLADIAQDPSGIAKATIETVEKHLNGETVDELIGISPYVIDKENAE